jgi:hypothetical protein
MSRRAILLTLLALLAPLPAVAVGGGSGPQSLSVSAALGGCGLIDNSVACRVDVSWSALAKADSYSVSVTAPGGSVVGSAETSGASTSLWIPYSGAGAYTVTVTAWGSEDGEEPAVIARERFGAETDERLHGAKDVQPSDAEPETDSDPVETEAQPEPEPEVGVEPEPQEPPPTEQPAPEQPAEAPSCPPTPAEPAAEASASEASAAEAPAETATDC